MAQLAQERRIDQFFLGPGARADNDRFSLAFPTQLNTGSISHSINFTSSRLLERDQNLASLLLGGV